MSAITYTLGYCASPDAGWVLATPFRAWLKHLSAATGFDPLTIAVAAGVPTRVGRSLATGDKRPRRIRAVDAMNLLSMDVGIIGRLGCTLTDAAPARQALGDLGSWCPDVETLIRATGINADTAAGLLDGWLDVCPKWVVWRCIALAQEITHRRTIAAYNDFHRTDDYIDDFEDDYEDDYEDDFADDEADAYGLLTSLAA